MLVLTANTAVLTHCQVQHRDIGVDQPVPAGAEGAVLVQLGVEACHHLKGMIFFYLELVIGIDIGVEVIALVIVLAY